MTAEPIDVEVEQLPLAIELLSDQQKWAAARGGVGSGKTYALCYWMLDRMEEYPKAAHFAIGADYEMLRRGFFVTFVQILESHGLEQGRDFSYRESPSPMVIFKWSGARLRSLSAQLAERIRSTEIQSMLLEEPQTWHNGQGIWEILSARLRHNPRSARLYPAMQTRGRMSFNPPSKSHWLFGLIERSWVKEGYRCYRFSVRDNELMHNQAEYVHNLEINLPESRWPAEIDGHWREAGGGTYREFMRSIHCPAVVPAGLPPLAWVRSPQYPIAWSLDFNVEWNASVLGQWHRQAMVTKGLKPVTLTTTVLQRIIGPAVDGWQEHIFYQLGEIFLNNVGTPDVIEEFLRRYKEITGPMYGEIPVELYGDPAGGGKSQTMAAASSARSPWEQVREALTKAGIPFVWYVRSAAPSQLDRVSRHNEQFRTGQGFGMILDEPECPNTIDDYELVEWSKTVVNTIDKSDKSDAGRKRTHLADAAGYMFDVRRLLARRVELTWKSFMGR